MNIVIPMAGRGTRLACNDQHVPKPFVKVAGRPLWWWSVSGLPTPDGTRIIFVVLDEHVERSTFRAEVARAYPRCDVRVVTLSEVTDGQLCTVLSAASEFDFDEPLIIYNADTFVRQDNTRLLQLLAEADGVVGTTSRPGHSWSFVRKAGDGEVVEVAEKVRISDLVCTGLYCFRSCATFLTLSTAHLLVDQSKATEYFVAPLFNDYLASSMRIVTLDTETFLPVGTPTELIDFQQFVSMIGPAEFSVTSDSRAAQSPPRTDAE